MTPFVTRGPSPVWLFGTFFVFFRCAVRVGLTRSGRRFHFILLGWRAGGGRAGVLSSGEQTLSLILKGLEIFVRPKK